VRWARWGVRDYSLAGAETPLAGERGLAEGEWYRAAIDPQRLRELSVRSNRHAGVTTVTWLALIIASGSAAYMLLQSRSWWALLAFFVYGTLYGGAADSRWHESGHGTAFESDLANTLTYYPASFMLFREPTLWRWSHVRHHSDTIVVGRDAEIIFPRPPKVSKWLGNYLNLFGAPAMLKRMVSHAGGKISEADKSYIPESQHGRVVTEARVFLAILGLVVAWCLLSWSIVPALFIGLPTFYGAWLVLLFGTTQHAGLREDVLDHRLNTRTVYMNPVFRYLYLNMNYHVEHHLFPTVPYHALPALHDEVKDQLVEPTRSTIAAYREIVPALVKQRRDPTWEIPRVLPPGEKASVTGYVPESSVRITGSLIDIGGSQGAWISAGPAGDLKLNDVVRVDHGSDTYALYRLPEGVFATDGICTHSRRVHLADGVVVGSAIECPKHNGRFDIATGDPLRAPVCDALKTFEVSEVDGELRIAKPG
jgi:Na+-transporting NADH:ubiquinone oxidoreductase subunit F